MPADSSRNHYLFALGPDDKHITLLGKYKNITEKSELLQFTPQDLQQASKLKSAGIYGT